VPDLDEMRQTVRKVSFHGADGLEPFFDLPYGDDSFSREFAMKGFVDDIEKLTEGNSNFRRVLYTAKRVQLVVMALKPGEEIGEEVHKDRDQFFRLEQGNGEISIDGTVTAIKTGIAMLVPAGSRHNIKNTGDNALKLYTLYAPPNHAEGTVHATKAVAEASKEHFDGRTTE
jgi:mannose-6-phosphate isomerase-like protein (cupin superfamily)